jgi:hypothetical protein
VQQLHTSRCHGGLDLGRQRFPAIYAHSAAPERIRERGSVGLDEVDADRRNAAVGDQQHVFRDTGDDHDVLKAAGPAFGLSFIRASVFPDLYRGGCGHRRMRITTP